MANASPSRLLALGVVGSIERKEGRFNTNSALRGLVAAGAGGEGVGGGAVQTCSHNPFCTPPSAHCVPIPPWRTLHAPSGGSSTTLAARAAVEVRQGRKVRQATESSTRRENGALLPSPAHRVAPSQPIPPADLRSVVYAAQTVSPPLAAPESNLGDRSISSGT